jgi:predicted secreted protein
MQQFDPTNIHAKIPEPPMNVARPAGYNASYTAMPAGSITINVDSDNLFTVQDMSVGQHVRITGYENITTGYSYQHELDTNCEGIEVVENKHVRQTSGMMGAPGERQIELNITDKARDGVVCNVYLKMARPWLMKDMAQPDHTIGFRVVNL